MFDDKFSENFDDSVNDEDSEGDDLNADDRRKIIDYIRMESSGRRDLAQEDSDE